MNEIEKNEDEALKNQVIGWSVMVVATLIGLALGAGTFSALVGLFTTVLVMVWRLKRNERKEGAK